MTVTFRCGHTTTLPATIAAAPTCTTCGEQVVSRVQDATPRFVGICHGPYATFRELEPIPVDLRSVTKE